MYKNNFISQNNIVRLVSEHSLIKCCKPDDIHLLGKITRIGSKWHLQL